MGQGDKLKVDKLVKEKFKLSKTACHKIQCDDAR